MHTRSFLGSVYAGVGLKLSVLKNKTIEVAKIESCLSQRESQLMPVPVVNICAVTIHQSINGLQTFPHNSNMFYTNPVCMQHSNHKVHFITLIQT